MGNAQALGAGCAIGSGAGALASAGEGAVAAGGDLATAEPVGSALKGDLYHYAATFMRAEAC